MAIPRQIDRERARRVNAFEAAVQRWMLKRAREESARLVRGLERKGQRWAISKHRAGLSVVSKKEPIDEEFLAIIMRFGVAQAKDASARATDVKGINRIIDPKSMRRELAGKEFRLKVFTALNGWAEKRVRRVSAETKDMVRSSIIRVIDDAAGEVPTPSPGEMARRIRTQFHGEDPKSRIYAWSPERAALIVRTELNMADNTGAHRGYQLLDTMSADTEWEPRKRWLSKRDGKSGDRRHDEMHNVTIQIDEDFVLPDGTRMKHPGDPSAPIFHLANCRCAERVVMVRRKPKR